MKSFILITKDHEKKISYINNFAKEKKVGKFDIHFFEPGEHSFGISDVRLVQKTAFIKPMQSKEKILVLSKAESLTTEAQNALLKLLEEPPSNTYIFLFALSNAQFLPTILSRCTIIVLDDKTRQLSPEEKEILKQQFIIIQKGTIGKKLALSEIISKEKGTVSIWLENSILLVREHILASPKDQSLVLLIKSLQQARTFLKTTNVSPRLILEHCFLSLRCHPELFVLSS